MRRFSVFASAGLLALSLAGCGNLGGEESLLDKDSIVVGVKGDQPGLGLKDSGSFEGFDVDTAKYVARKLGFGPGDVKFKAVSSQERDQRIVDGELDLVLATYSITAERKTKITFGGPYYVAHQDTLVRPADAKIDNVRDLKGRKLCQVSGSNSWKRVTEERRVAAELVPADSYTTCISDLKSGKVDAVSTDDLILAGYVAAESAGLRFVNAPFSDEKYGIGMKKGDLDACEAVNKAVTEMYQDGTAAGLLSKWFGKSGLRLNTSVPQFEGCA